MFHQHFYIILSLHSPWLLFHGHRGDWNPSGVNLFAGGMRERAAHVHAQEQAADAPQWVVCQCGYFFLFTIYSVFFLVWNQTQRFQSTESPWARQHFLVEVGPWRISSPFKLAFLCQLVTKRTSDASQCWNHSCQGIIKAVFTTLAISRFLCDLVATRGGDAWTSETPKVVNPQDGAFWPPKNLSFYSDFCRELGASSTCF